MGVACLCPCGRRWPVAVDLATHRGEVALLCPGCGREAGRLLCGTDLDATVPPSQADADRTQPPAFGIDEEVEPEEVGVGAPTRPLGEYELLGELGRGGMGVVYKARHRTLNRVVALKMILSAAHVGADGRARFRDEAEAIARLRHPNIVQIYDIGELGGDDFFSLEFCPGGSLARKLHGKPLPPGDAAATVEAVSRAVQAAHDAGIVHRDLKPGNILLDADGVPKVTDFGLAKKLDDSSGKTRTGAVMGTPSYMAPEQAEGKKDVGPPADVYALGAILYECLTGRPPFQAATSFDTIVQVVSDEPVPPR
jgi:serine/threonine protein kinase